MRRGGLTRKILPLSSGRGAAGGWRYSSLKVGDMDEIPLMRDEGVEEEEEEQEEESGTWHQMQGRNRWSQRMMSYSTLLGLICGGGWQVGLSK